MTPQTSHEEEGHETETVDEKIGRQGGTCLGMPIVPHDLGEEDEQPCKPFKGSDRKDKGETNEGIVQLP